MIASLDAVLGPKRVCSNWVAKPEDTCAYSIILISDCFNCYATSWSTPFCMERLLTNTRRKLCDSSIWRIFAFASLVSSRRTVSHPSSSQNLRPMCRNFGLVALLRPEYTVSLKKHSSKSYSDICLMTLTLCFAESCRDSWYSSLMSNGRDE